MVLVIVALAVAACAVVASVAAYRSAWRLARRRRVVVVLESGVSVEGVLWRTAGPLLVLRDATIHAEATSPVAGEVVIERHQVQWLQVLP